MFFDDIISASFDLRSATTECARPSGRRRSRRERRADERMMRIALPSTSNRLERRMPGDAASARGSAGRDARESPLRARPTNSGPASPTSPCCCLMVATRPRSSSLLYRTLEQLERHLLRQPHWCSLARDRRRSPNGRSSQRACRAGSDEPALLAVNVSLNDLSGRLLAHAHAAAAAVVEQRVHGFLEHAFSLRMMTSGALSSISFFTGCCG